MTEYLRALQGRYSTVVLSAKTPDVSHIERYHGARLLRVPVGAGDLSSRAQAFERAVRRQLESEEYAVVHFMDPFGGYPLCELRVEHNFRTVYDAQSFPSLELRYTHPQLEGDRKLLSKVRRQELYCLMNSDLVLTGSPLTQRYIYSLGVAPDHVQVVRAPVATETYASQVVGEPTQTPIRLLYLGSQVGWQGVPVLLHAFKRMLGQAPGSLTLAGPRQSEWQRRLEELVTELGLSAHVSFHPAVAADALPGLLANCDVGLLPLEDSERNRLQGGELAKASDYLAAGRPVVASDLPITRELLPAAATRFFPAGDATALADLLVQLAKTPQLRAELGAQGRAEAQRILSSAVLKPRLLELYAELLRRSGLKAPTGVSDHKDPTHTATPTSRVLEGRPGTGTTPAGRLGGPPSKSAQPDTEPALRTRRSANGETTQIATLPAPEGVEEVQLEDIVEVIDTFSGPAPRAPVSLPAGRPSKAGVPDPWFAQLLYGYCPPDGVEFARHTPPTNFPGRDDGGRPPG